ncbi:MAG: hypothetical protein B7Z66_15105 [Chromatiales bacterium 21-64-14]|nr:MAG: hypothetical protein B7Z66_15105 [Chromatiales bacterium 21-64-14]
MASNVTTPYSISTITAVGDVGVLVDLADLLRTVPIGPDGSGSDIRVVRAELDGRALGEEEPPPKTGRRRSRVRDADVDGKLQGAAETPKKRFANQATLVFAVAESSTTRVNMKVFRNGRVQLTGAKRVEQGREVVERLVEFLRGCCSSCCSCRGQEAPDPRVAEYRVCLINSDFDVGFSVRRDALHRLVRDRFPRVPCCYEPCIYPGVQVRYHWNCCAPSGGAADDGGFCRCGDVPCDGRGEGDGPGRCRKVTCSVFQSGKAIVVGAHTMQQLDDAYRFLVDRLLMPHRELLRIGAP